MNVLLSIEPKYADAIFSGDKKYEFRRVIFKRRDISKIYVYCNSSVKKIVGSFESGGLLQGTPEEIWKQCQLHSGISKKDFFKYFEGSKKAFAIKVKKAHRFSRPINPYVNERFVAPQSFYYFSRIEKVLNKDVTEQRKLR